MTKQFWWKRYKMGNKLVSQRMTKYCTNIGEECSRKLQRFSNICKIITNHANNKYLITLFIRANKSFDNFIDTYLGQKYLCNTPKAKLSYKAVKLCNSELNTIFMVNSHQTLFTN